MTTSRNNPAISARRYIVKGRVQGVGYRYFAKNAAEKLGLSGYARNLDDGTVEVVAVGPPRAVEEILAALQRGPRMAEVRGVEYEPAPVQQYGSFDIR
jgi:acylphosphatase